MSAISHAVLIAGVVVENSHSRVSWRTGLEFSRIKPQKLDMKDGHKSGASQSVLIQSSFFPSLTHEPMPQTFSVLQHVMGESLNNGEPDAIRGKHEWTVVAECDVGGLDQQMKKCL